MRNVFLLVFILNSITLFCQKKPVVVDMEVRNAAIRIANNAGSEIKNGNFGNATKLLVQSIRLDSLLRENYDMLYKSAVSSNNCSDSILRIFSNSRRIYNEDDELFFYTGEIFRLRNDLQSAINEYTLAIKYSLLSSQKSFYLRFYYLNRADSYFKLKKYNEAEKDYSASLIMKPDNAATLINRGICYYYSGKKEEAEKDWMQANKLGSPVAASYLKRLK